MTTFSFCIFNLGQACHTSWLGLCSLLHFKHWFKTTSLGRPMSCSGSALPLLRPECLFLELQSNWLISSSETWRFGVFLSKSQETEKQKDKFPSSASPKPMLAQPLLPPSQCRVGKQGNEETPNPTGVRVPWKSTCHCPGCYNVPKSHPL